METYFVLNRSNGKSYTGWTATTAQKRFKRHCSSARRGSSLYFHRAIRKYGVDAFDVLTVWKGTDANEMKQVERNYIAGMRTNDQRCGYNMTAGGDGVLGHKHSEESKKRMVDNHPPLTEAQRKAQSDLITRQLKDPKFRAARVKGMLGHPVSDAAKAKLSAAQKGSPRWTAEDKARIKAQRAKQVITPEHRAAISAGLLKYLSKNPRDSEKLARFRKAGADALRGKPWSLARRTAHEKRVSLRAR